MVRFRGMKTLQKFSAVCARTVTGQGSFRRAPLA